MLFPNSPAVALFFHQRDSSYLRLWENTKRESKEKYVGLNISQNNIQTLADWAHPKTHAPQSCVFLQYESDGCCPLWGFPLKLQQH